uniref:Uncharacterized protein n=1 Tax=Arundo donax TaxID=35708 RepID=A0A0A9G7C0_ARUDO
MKRLAQCTDISVHTQEMLRPRVFHVFIAVAGYSVRGPWGARSPIPENNAIAINKQVNN